MIDSESHEHVRKDVGYAIICEVCRKPLSGLPMNAGAEFMPIDKSTGFVDVGELNERRARAARYEAKFGKRVGGYGNAAPEADASS